MADVKTNYRIGVKDETRKGFKEIERSIGLLEKQTKSFARSFAVGVAGAFSVSAIASGVKSVIDLGDKLRDLSFSTGQSVEQLSFLDFAAKQSGTSIESLSSATIKFGKNLVDISSGRGKAAAEALDRLGLSVAELSSKDLASQISIIGERLAALPNPAERAAFGVALFGKQFKQLAPLILEGEQGIGKLADRFVELGGVITTEQANKFDALNDAIGEFGISSRAAGIAIADFAAGPLTKFFQVLSTIPPFAREIFTKFIDDIIFSTLSLQIQIEKTTNAISNFFNRRSGRGAQGGDDGTREITDRIRELRAVQNEIAKEVDRRALGRVSGADARGRVLSGGSFEALAQSSESLAKETDKIAKAAEKAAQALRSESDEVRNFLQDYAKDRERAFQAEIEQARQRAQSLRESVATPQERGLAALKEFNETFGANSEEFGRKAIEVFNELNPEIEKAKDATEELRAVGEDLGFTFSSAFEDAIVNGAKLSEVIKGIGQDILRIAIRKSITKPFSKLLGDVFESGDIAEFFKGFGFGGARAAGGAVSRGKAYLVGEDGPELFFPGRSGAISPNRGGGGGVVVNINNYGNAKVDRRVSPDGRTIDIAIDAALARSVNSGRSARTTGLVPGLAAR